MTDLTLDDLKTIFDDNDVIDELYKRYKEKKALLVEMKIKLKNSNISLQSIAPLLEPDIYQRMLLSFQAIKLEYENLEYQIDECDDLHLDDRREWPSSKKY